MKKSFKTYALLIALSSPIWLFALMGLPLLFTKNSNTNNVELKNPVEIKDNTQIINITAKGGYFPKIINAKAGLDSILRVHTQNTFDCSAALVISELKYNEILKPSGYTEIKIPSQSQGKTIKGSCSMNMYAFQITFE